MNYKEQSVQLEASPEFRHLEESPVAFFCAEYALGGNSDMFAGGLGVLAADFLAEAADSGLPFVALGLRYGTGNLEGFLPALSDEGAPLLLEVPIQKRTVFAKAWMKKFGKSAVLFLLDSSVAENSPEDREITRVLYDQRFYCRLSQQMLLGIGGIRLLDRMSISPARFHLNEGHAAFAGMAAIAEEARRRGASFKSVLCELKNKIVATKHTIFSGAGTYIRSHEFFEFVEKYCREQNVDQREVFATGQLEEDSDSFSTTKFVLQASCRHNGVSALHTVAEKEVHSDSSLFPITNGVHRSTWQFSGWNPAPASSMDNAGLWRTKNKLREEMVSFANKFSGSNLDKDFCTVVWARRFAAYKRPEALFQDVTRLKKLCLGRKPLQFIVSGRGSDADEEGKRTSLQIKTLAKDPSFKGRISFIPDYSLQIAAPLVRGADIWLNTPMRGKEACGTSGMKAGLNGALVMSVSDGWIDEINWDGKGWILPDGDIGPKIYDFLEEEVAPEFYNRDQNGIPASWVLKMKAVIEIVESRFTTERMLHDYLKQLYKF